MLRWGVSVCDGGSGDWRVLRLGEGSVESGGVLRLGEGVRGVLKIGGRLGECEIGECWIGGLRLGRV